MSNKIEDKDRYRAWAQYIKRPTPPSIDSAFDWAWLAQERKIQVLQKENEILKEALGFYADLRNYNYSQEYKIAEYWNDLKDDWDFGSKESVEYNKNKTPLVFGGKRARQALKQLTEGEE